MKPDLIFETETRLFLLLCLLVTQVPPHVGVCHAQLMHELCMYVANVRRGVAGCTPGTPLSDVKQAARDIAEGTVTLYRKCKLTTQSSSDVTYWAVPEFRHHDDHVRARFDFVEEWAELWAWSNTRPPCRPVVQLRGFVQVELENDETHNISIAQNLQPHDDAAIDDTGNPRHPTYTVLHCLWQLQRYVLPGCVAGWLPGCPVSVLVECLLVSCMAGQASDPPRPRAQFAVPHALFRYRVAAGYPDRPWLLQD